MGRKTALFLAILTAVMLSGCNKQTEEAAVETVQVTTVSEVMTTAETTAEVTTSTEAETTAAETTSAVEEDNALPAVYSADQKYEFYPMEIIYPEKQETDITAEAVEIREGLCNADGYLIVGFDANYPVFSSESVDSAVLDKINSAIKAYIDEAYEYERTFAEEYVAHDENEFTEFPYTLCGFIHERQLKYNIGYSECVGYDVCGNILSVNFVDYGYGAGAAHGIEAPVPMMFDLRTGEQIKLSEMVVDKVAFSERVMISILDVMFKTRFNRGNYYVMSDYNDFIMEEMASAPAEKYGIDENGELIIGYCKADTRLTVKNGCVGFFIAPYEYGCYADGIRLAKVPVDDLLPYMNDEGKALFEGIVSATAEPVMLTVEDGTEKIISREQAEKLLSEGE
ncbi:MAG: DUF4163 domain-containing protein [Oscillospiraceae bacterium]|nr:DUF4163 domain-containing protein [Oscillospiraceae bacterium]